MCMFSHFTVSIFFPSGILGWIFFTDLSSGSLIMSFLPNIQLHPIIEFLILVFVFQS